VSRGEIERETGMSVGQNDGRQPPVAENFLTSLFKPVGDARKCISYRR
jgi:hypothetical protein